MAKVLGSVEKMRPGPELGSKSNEKTAGKIANPVGIDVYCLDPVRQSKKAYFNVKVPLDFLPHVFFD